MMISLEGGDDELLSVPMFITIINVSQTTFHTLSLLNLVHHVSVCMSFSHNATTKGALPFT
jgi:hypothetical protein